MKKATPTKVRRTPSAPAKQARRKSQDVFAGMDPKFVAAAKLSKKRFAPLFKRLAKT